MVSLWIFPKRFLARSKQILRRFARSVSGQMPPSPRRYGGQTETDRISTGIEHQAKCALLIFMDQTCKLFFFRVGPVGQSSLWGKPMDLGVRIELFLTQNRMGAAKCDHALDKPVDLPMPFKMGPVDPTRFVVLAVGIVVAALRAAKFVAAEQHRARHARSAGSEGSS